MDSVFIGQQCRHRLVYTKVDMYPIHTRVKKIYIDLVYTRIRKVGIVRLKWYSHKDRNPCGNK